MSSKKNIQAENTIPAGYTLDYVSGKQLKETNKELVRQRVVRALIHEYGFSPEDMDLDSLHRRPQEGRRGHLSSWQGTHHRESWPRCHLPSGAKRRKEHRAYP